MVGASGFLIAGWFASVLRLLLAGRFREVCLQALPHGQQVMHMQAKLFLLKRLGEIGVGAPFKSFQAIFNVCSGGQQNKRNMADAAALIFLLVGIQQLPA